MSTNNPLGEALCGIVDFAVGCLESCAGPLLNVCCDSNSNNNSNNNNNNGSGGCMSGCLDSLSDCGKSIMTETAECRSCLSECGSACVDEIASCVKNCCTSICTSLKDTCPKDCVDGVKEFWQTKQKVTQATDNAIIGVAQAVAEADHHHHHHNHYYGHHHHCHHSAVGAIYLAATVADDDRYDYTNTNQAGPDRGDAKSNADVKQNGDQPASAPTQPNQNIQHQQPQVTYVQQPVPVAVVVPNAYIMNQPIPVAIPVVATAPVMKPTPEMPAERIHQAPPAENLSPVYVHEQPPSYEEATSANDVFAPSHIIVVEGTVPSLPQTQAVYLTGMLQAHNNAYAASCSAPSVRVLTLDKVNQSASNSV